ncbi:hypothetical protein D910_06821 [Dendroctonus ponderosae]|uniref:C2H2-type domain-containing protein n=1 Tax=Dendroctonus ponderosae TaxID=77166 RepID=U4U6E9_DENPD|nr:hypothetical protein D910_06821 [Dendroctonus ponderosae]
MFSLFRQNPRSSAADAKLDNNYPCPKCGKAYKHRASLYNHTKFECGKEKSLECPVEDCLYKTKRKCSLKQHNPSIILFLNLFMYRCEACSRGYKHRASLYNHTKFECGQNRRFKCATCNFSSKRKGNLKNHITKMH